MERATSNAKKVKIKDKLISIELLLQKSHAEARSRKERLAVRAIKTNSKFFFNYAKQFSTTKSNIGPLLNKKNEYTNSSLEMGNIFSEQYSSVFSTPRNSPYFEKIDDPDIPILNDIIFTEKDLSDAIDELRNTAASGPDGFLHCFSRNVSHFS